jgi:methyltransferase
MAGLNTPLVWVLALVALQRLAELVLATTNTRRLLARGGREIGAGHYPLFIALHASWLAAIALSTPLGETPYWPLIGVFIVLQLVRVWVIATLGPYWTTRIITLDDAPIVRAGPYRYLRHPNYWVVVGEIAILPLAFHDWTVAIVWSILNALLLRHRIGVEGAALAERPEPARGGGVPGQAPPSPR